MGRIGKCYFCSGPIHPGYGTTFVRNDCKLFRFCKSKCHNNFKLRRNPRKTKWTKAFRWAANKEMNNDNVLHFEKKRNIPTRYNRELMAKTIKAMHRLEQIRVRRAKKFYDNRFKLTDKVEKRKALGLIRRHIHMVIAPVAVKGKKNFKNWRKQAITHLRKKQREGTLRLD